MQNFDSSQVGVPYVRIHNIHIDYPAPGDALVTYFESEAVKMADGTIRKLQEYAAQQMRITPADMQRTIPLVDATTGEALGANVSIHDVMQAILAVLRAHQVERAGPALGALEGAGQ